MQHEPLHLHFEACCEPTIRIQVSKFGTHFNYQIVVMSYLDEVYTCLNGFKNGISESMLLRTHRASGFGEVTKIITRC